MEWTKENKSVKKNFFAAAILDHLWANCSNLRPLLSNTFPQGFWISKNFGHPTLRSGGKKMFKWYLKSEQMKKNLWKKTFFCRGDFRPFLSKNVQIWDPFFPLLFPKYFKSLNILDIRLWEVGAKRRLSSTSKSEHTHTYISKMENITVQLN